MRLRHRVGTGAAVLLIACAAAFVLYRRHLSGQVDEALEAIRAQEYPVTLEELDALDEELQGADDVQFLTRALAGERCGMGAMARQATREGAVQLRDVLPADSALKTAFLSTVYGPSGLADRDFLLYLGLMAEAIEMFAEPEPTWQAKSAKLQERLDHIPGSCPLSASSTRYVPGLASSWAQTTANLRAARLALALERYRAQRGELPSSAERLVPEFIDAVPIDPFTGEPMHYTRLTTGYVAYSLAANGRDDGGIESRKASTALSQGDLTFTVERP